MRAALVIMGPLMILAAQSAAAKPGDLDPTFGTGGVVNTTASAQRFFSVGRLIRQPDGKLVATGHASTQHPDFELARFEISGSLDSSFGIGGVATVHVSGDLNSATALVRQPDGKLVAAGMSVTYETVGPPHGHVALVRYLVDGSPDMTFGKSGSVVNSAFETIDVNALLLQSDGKLIVVSTGSDFATQLTRYSQDGSVDTTFGLRTGSTQITSPPTGFPKAALLQPDGTVIVAVTTMTGPPRNDALVRYDSRGALDASFGSDGVATLGSTEGIEKDIARLPDGRLVVAATSPVFGMGERINYLLYVARPDGSLDAGFGTRGRVETAFGEFVSTDHSDPWANTTTAVAIQPDGKLLQVGRAAGPDGFTFLIIRYNPNGSLDATFGSGGGVMYPAGYPEGHGIVLQPDGKLVVGGSASNFTLVRYLLGGPFTGDTAIEYHNASFDHYFITSMPQEISKLDSGAVAGWQRTGQYFSVYANAALPAVPVCRFFSGQRFAPKSSHFYTPYAFECEIAQSSGNWMFEGNVMAMQLADADGRCGSETLPLYRLYNNGQGGAPNHRYTTSLTIRSEMIASGWIPEGAGKIGVVGCLPKD